jgi:hypothetical protein
MSIESRLRRLELGIGRGHKLRQTLEEFLALDAWLTERGYADAVADVEAGEAGPAALEYELRGRAECDRRHPAFLAVEAGLDAHRLQSEGRHGGPTGGQIALP